MNLLQSFGKFFAMFIDDEEHRQRHDIKHQQKPQQQQHNYESEEASDMAEDNDDFEMFDEM